MKLLHQRARPPHIRLVAGPEAVGDGEQVERHRLLVPGLGAEDVLADALGLLRLVEQPVSLGLGERSRDGLGAQRFQLEHGRLLVGESWPSSYHEAAKGAGLRSDPAMVERPTPGGCTIRVR